MATATDHPEQIVLGREEHAYGFIIEVLTKGLYPNKFHVIREYVQNAYDAILAWRRVPADAHYGQIDIKVASPSILIYDNGVGMNRAKVNQYRYVGYSEKRPGEGVGFRGIGKLSGISVAEKLIITSSPAGIAQRYKLVFDAAAMLAQIMALKLAGDNIPLNELIRTHTSIITEDEDPGPHYTFVELYKVRDDSKVLMDRESLTQYLGMNAPADFDPEFPYAKTVDGWLREHVLDYDTVRILLNGAPVFKPCLPDLNPPQMIFVWGEAAAAGQMEGEDQGPELLAFSWFCEHARKGQLEDQLRRGLFYRVKNFAVGDNHLPRATLWRSSPERAYYFFGEIHVCDRGIVPSSERSTLEHNTARDRLYARGIQISQTLNKIAGKSSDQRRAQEFIVVAEGLINAVQAELQSNQLPKEVTIDKIVSVSNAIDNVTKRLHHAPEPFQNRGEEVIKKANELIAELSRAEPGQPWSGLYDITQTLKLGSEASRVYEIIVDTLKDEFADQPALYERLVRRIHTALEERLS